MALKVSLQLKDTEWLNSLIVSFEDYYELLLSTNKEVSIYVCVLTSQMIFLFEQEVLHAFCLII